MSLFVAGKRDLIVKDLESAVENFAKSCELLSSVFGDTAYECADAYYYYGKALLDLARMESGVFGNALDGVPEGEDEEDSEESEESEEKEEEEKKESLEKEEAGPRKDSEPSKTAETKDKEDTESL